MRTSPLSSTVTLLVILTFGSLCLAGMFSGQKMAYENILCQANLREIHFAIYQYAADHDGRLPNANNRDVRPWTWWDQGLHQYVTDLRIFYCPAATPGYFPLLQTADPTVLQLRSGETIAGVPLDVRDHYLLLSDDQGEVFEVSLEELPRSEAFRWMAEAAGERSPLLPVSWDRRNIGYGMNYQFSSAFAKIESYSLDRILHPEKLILVADANHALLRPTRTVWENDCAPRHEGRSNFLFADGHVESLDPLPDEYTRPGASGIMNSIHWVPEFSP